MVPSTHLDVVLNVQCASLALKVLKIQVFYLKVVLVSEDEKERVVAHTLVLK